MATNQASTNRTPTNKASKQGPPRAGKRASLVAVLTLLFLSAACSGEESPNDTMPPSEPDTETSGAFEQDVATISTVDDQRKAVEGNEHSGLIEDPVDVNNLPTTLPEGLFEDTESFCGDFTIARQHDESEQVESIGEVLRRWDLADRVPLGVAERVGSIGGIRCSGSWMRGEEYKYSLLLLSEDGESGIALSNDRGHLLGSILHERQNITVPPLEQWSVFVGVPDDSDSPEVEISSLIMKEGLL